MRIATLSLLTILCLALSAPAFADLYNNGPTLGTTNAWFVDVYAVSDSFTVSANAAMTSFTFAEWVAAGATPLTVDWSVGTSSFGSDVGSGTGNISASLICSNGQGYNGGSCAGGFGYDIYASTVNTGNLNLTAGTTYWLSLTNATDNFGGRDGWDINSGASMAYHNLLGQVPSESFTINGAGTTTTTTSTTGGSTPEPSSIMLFGSGVLGLAGVLRRKLSL